MPKPTINLVGQRFGHLEVIERAPATRTILGKSVTNWLVMCHAKGVGCVGQKIVTHSNLTTKLQSCGCVQKQAKASPAKDRLLLEDYSLDYVLKIRAIHEQGQVYTTSKYVQVPVPGETYFNEYEVVKHRRKKKAYYEIAHETGLTFQEVKRICTGSLDDPKEVAELKRLQESWRNNPARLAFDGTVSAWQERLDAFNGLVTIQPATRIDGGRATHTGNTRIIRPFLSDFIADVELAARRVLTAVEFLYFTKTYRDSRNDLSHVGLGFRKLDDTVRHKVGEELERVGLYPVERYFLPKLARKHGERSWSFGKVLNFPTVPQTRPEASSGPRGGAIDISAAAEPCVVSFCAAAADAPAGFEKLLTPPEAAALLQVHPVTLRKWAREGRVPSIKLGRKVAFRASDLDLWVRSQVQYTQANRLCA